MKFYAHKNQTLVAHLQCVAKQAGEFASFFGAAEQGNLAGLLHDLGKAEENFLTRIESNDTKGKKEPHAHHGAALLLDDRPDEGFVAKPFWPVAFAINGHHAGLHDRHDLQKIPSAYSAKARAAVRRVKEDWGSNAWPLMRDELPPHLPAWLQQLPFDATFTSEGWRAVDFYTRFLFSALVDADRLDSEGNELGKEKSAEQRQWRKFNATALLDMVEDRIKAEGKKARDSQTAPNVLTVRDEVANFCRRPEIHQKRGVFTLTVPTGGGKTLASLLFALTHAKHHNQRLKCDSTPTDDAAEAWRHPIRRVIIVIPFLSIIQQTAEKLQRLFGDIDENGKALASVRTVLEHHSQAADPPLPDREKSKKDDPDGFGLLETRRRLAAENWDAPIVVTTSVQFFDSLFSRRPADARKLHNIAQSVIVFDEVQMLPPHLLRPILDALGEFTSPERPYGCSVVLCTATQPALAKDPETFPDGAGLSVSPIIPEDDAKRHFRELDRTCIIGLKKDGNGPVALTPEQLVDALLKAPNQQALAIVNTRKAARRCFDSLRKACKENSDLLHATFHLSTWMTPAHRLEVLREVRQRLDAKKPCLLISTQCIEAGVDVDFPAVWRAYGPYDSIVQAAGRCNRNGKLGKQGGVVQVFKLVDDKGEQMETLPKGVYASATEQTGLLCRLGLAKPEEPDSFTTYFRFLYQTNVPDDCEIQRERGQLHFERVSELFHLIDTFSVPLIVPKVFDPAKSSDADIPMSSDDPTPVAQWLEKTLPKGFLTPVEWRSIQPHLLNIDLHNAALRSQLFSGQIAAPAIPGEKPDECSLWRLTACSLYQGGLHGAGLDGTASLINPLLGGL
ncbi:MAG: CRISPR-associated helicase Cas3' [Verrucomicrobia bacterium]|nr:CRISPR-associated helicase Cas3' [Verrucomicrobiota bacterium]